MNPSAHITRAEIRRTEAGLVLHWETEPEGAPVHVYAANAHDAPAHELRLLAADHRETAFRPEAGEPSPRPYFVLKAGSGAPLRLAERVLPLQGAHNFRDLGGYRTRSGQRIKWGLLFRSEHLTNLSEADCDYLRDIGIRSVFDLRTRVERERNPSRWHPQSRVETISWKDSGNLKGLGERMQQYRKEHGLEDAAHLRGFLSLHYRNYVEVQVDKYRDILAKLTRPGAAPALIHCTAGKDRTGIIVALILSLLGVEEDTIFEDYLLTNACADDLRDQARFRMLLKQFGIDRISDEGVDALRCAHAEYLQSAFDGLRENYGSVENYLDRRLGVDAEKINRLRTLYLEG